MDRQSQWFTSPLVRSGNIPAATPTTSSSSSLLPPDVLTMHILSDANHTVALGCADATIKLFQHRRPNHPHTDTAEPSTMAATLVQEWTSALTTGQDLKSPVISLRPLQQQQQQRSSINGGASSTSSSSAPVLSTPTSVLVAACTDGGISTWHIGSGKRLQRWGAPPPPQGGRLPLTATASFDERTVKYLPCSMDVLNGGGSNSGRISWGPLLHHGAPSFFSSSVIAFGCLDGTVRLTDPTRFQNASSSSSKTNNMSTPQQLHETSAPSSHPPPPHGAVDEAERFARGMSERYVLEMSHATSAEWLPMGSQRLNSVRFLPATVAAVGELEVGSSGVTTTTTTTSVENSPVLISGGWGRVVHLWDTRTGLSDSTNKAVGPYLVGDGLAVSPFHCHQFLTASSSTEGRTKGASNLEQWDLRALGKGPTAQRSFYASSFSSSSSLAQQQKQQREEQKQQEEVELALYSLAPSPCGRYVAVAGAEGLATVVQWNTLEDVVGSTSTPLCVCSAEVRDYARRIATPTTIPQQQPKEQDERGRSITSAVAEAEGTLSSYFCCSWSADGTVVGYGGSRGAAVTMRVA